MLDTLKMMAVEAGLDPDHAMTMTFREVAQRLAIRRQLRSARELVSGIVRGAR